MWFGLPGWENGNGQLVSAVSVAVPHMINSSPFAHLPFEPRLACMDLTRSAGPNTYILSSSSLLAVQN